VQVLAALPTPPIESVSPADVQLATVHLSRRPDTDRVAGGCLAATPDAWPAYAILTGVAPAALAGSVVLVDPAGWLRSVIRSDGGTVLGAPIAPMLSEIIHHPIAPPTGEAHAHK